MTIHDDSKKDRRTARKHWYDLLLEHANTLKRRHVIRPFCRDIASPLTIAVKENHGGQ